MEQVSPLRIASIRAGAVSSITDAVKAYAVTADDAHAVSKWKATTSYRTGDSGLSAALAETLVRCLEQMSSEQSTRGVMVQQVRFQRAMFFFLALQNYLLSIPQGAMRLLLRLHSHSHEPCRFVRFEVVVTILSKRNRSDMNHIFY